MALPLKVGNTMIGVLDVHSEQSTAFTQDDIAILQTMADQLATAIERTQLLQEVEYNLKELEKAYGQYTREGWQKLGSSGQLSNRGYRFDNIRIEPISSVPDTGSERVALGKNEPPNGKKAENSLAIPIKLRGQTIGVVNAKLKEGFNPKTVSTLQAATERLAVALESARLYEEARARADREQAIAQVTTKISSSTEFEAILRTTVEEIGKSINNSEVSIQILENLDDQNPNS
ncbi:MAG: GAF domain-containing protein [Anaerolineales bacterium]